MKKIAVGGAVLLVAVLAFEVPKMMKSGNTSAAPAAATTTGAPTTPTATTPAGTAAAAVTPTAASTKLPNSETLPRVGKSQLYSFSHFAAKDPFVQQIDPSSGSGTSPTSAPSAAKAPKTGTQTAAGNRRQSSRTLAVNGAARIAVNGRVQVVRVGASFPSANPLFRLVSVGNGVARIGIANGSYSSGARSVSLISGRTLTLVDTADGIRYQLRLLA
jgi:hypothetical protein